MNLHTVYAVILEAIQAAEFKFESKFEPLPVIWQTVAISPKAVPEGNRRFRGQNQRPSSWGSSPALLASVGPASTNTGCFRVSGSLCWRRLKISGRDESFVQVVVMRNENFDGIGEKLLPTKAAPIASLNLSIIH